MKTTLLSFLLWHFSSQLMGGIPVLALPPPEDVPEEVLRTQIITEAVSPIDGKPLSPAEYAQLQQELQAASPNTQLSPQVREVIFLLRIRQLLRKIGIPIR